MKKLKTKPFEEIEVDETQELTFNNGLFGFENYKKFYLLENPESPFIWLQSSDDPNLAFIMIHPPQFKSDYKLQLSAEDLKEIEINEENIKKDLLDFAIVTIPEDTSQMTANLQGPVIINISKKLGKQTISNNEKYQVKCKIVDEMKSRFGNQTDSKKKER